MAVRADHVDAWCRIPAVLADRSDAKWDVPTQTFDGDVRFIDSPESQQMWGVSGSVRAWMMRMRMLGWMGNVSI